MQEVTKAQGEELAKKYGMKFIETSAKTGTGVEEVRPPPLCVELCARGTVRWLGVQLHQRMC